MRPIGELNYVPHSRNIGSCPITEHPLTLEYNSRAHCRPIGANCHHHGNILTISPPLDVLDLHICPTDNTLLGTVSSKREPRFIKTIHVLWCKVVCLKSRCNKLELMVHCCRINACHTGMVKVCSPMHLQLTLISSNEPIDPAWAKCSKIWVAYVCNLECVSLNILATDGKALIGTHQDVIYELLALSMIQPSTLSSYIQTAWKPSNPTTESFLWHIAHARDFRIRWDFIVVEECIVARLQIELYSC
jgi:hypothetical protein